MREGRLGRRVVGLALAVAAMGLLAPVAAAEHRTVDRMSTGPAGGNGQFDASAWQVSADGSRLFFVTQERLVSTDTDDRYDVYERSGSSTTLLSTGPTGGNGDEDAFINEISADGSHVFFYTRESLVASDSDLCTAPPDPPQGCYDVYDRSGGTTTLVSTAPGPSGSFDASYLGTSSDGTHVIFSTQEQLVGADHDASFDLYQRLGGTTTLISTGPASSNAEVEPYFDLISADGSRVFFETTEKLVSSDTDDCSGGPPDPPSGCYDLYMRSGSTTTLVSTGPTGTNAASDVYSSGFSSDGLHVFFVTNENLTSTDTDSGCTGPGGACYDVYDRSGGTTTLVSAGSFGGNGSFDAAGYGASADGSRAWFGTSEPMISGDLDSEFDLYERSGGSTSLVSTGPAGGNGPFSDVNLVDHTPDGTHVYFATAESLVSADTNSDFDLYERFAGTTSQISTGPTGSGTYSYPQVIPSADGSRVSFETSQSLVADDTDNQNDVYQRFGGATSLISSGPSGGNGDFGAYLTASSADGTIVFFDGQEALTEDDTDTTWDIFRSSVAPPSNSFSGTLAPGGSGSTNSTVDADDPVGTKVTNPSAGGTSRAVTINEVTPPTQSIPSAFSPLTWQVNTTATPAATAASPLTFEFRVDGSIMPAGVNSTNVQVFRNGVLVPTCSGAPGTASPDPCLSARMALGGGGDAKLTVLSSTAGTWNFGWAKPRIVVVENAIPNDPQDFGFTAGGGLSPGSFQLDDDADPTLSNTFTFADLAPGSGYSVSQNAVSGWYLGKSSCDDSSPPGSITLSPAETVTCTFISSRTYPRPGGASPLRVPLVPNFAPCTAPNSSHVQPLDHPSCTPASRTSAEVTLHSDGSGQAFARLVVQPGDPATQADEADVQISANLTGVYWAKYGGYQYGGPGLIFDTTLRITDMANDSSGVASATVQDTRLSAFMNCGFNCSWQTTADALVPNMIKEQKRMVISLLGVRILDAGLDQVINVPGCPPTCGSGDEATFLDQGIFAP